MSNVITSKLSNGHCMLKHHGKLSEFLSCRDSLGFLLQAKTPFITPLESQDRRSMVPPRSAHCVSIPFHRVAVPFRLVAITFRRVVVVSRRKTPLICQEYMSEILFDICPGFRALKIAYNNPSSVLFIHASPL